MAIELLTLETGQRKTLIQGSPYAHYLPTGHLIFLVDGVLKAAPLDLEKQELIGTPVDLVAGVRQQQYSGTGAFSCSQTGTCVYIAGSTATARTLTMVDRTGAAQPLSFPAQSYTAPRFSPRGDKVAVWVEQLRCDIQVLDLTRATVTRLTSEGDNHSPIWTLDGGHITYLGQKARGSSRDIVSRPANGSGSEEALSATPRDLSPEVALAWSPSGVLAFADRGTIWVMPPAGEAHAFVQSRFNATAPAFSPDGRWLAYVSDESGRYDVYVRPFPGPGEKYMVSTAGGMEPVWSRNSRELFFRNGDQVLAVQVATTTAAFSASRPKVLFTGPFARARTAHRIAYDISPDGEHFVMLNSGEEDRAVTQVSVLLNWFEELKARVPAK
jgi:serine/threonine-protein kinase